MRAPRLRQPNPATLRRLTGGEVIGSGEPEGVHAWRGIRYARAPVGALRWRAPQPAPPWEGVLQALQHGPMAPQYADLLSGAPRAMHGRIIGDEDCLSLNVFAPAWAPDEVPQRAQRRPVMVWIHGGGNAVGTSSTYDAIRNLALHDGVVAVTVNYRLGVLGWFTHPALHEADAATPEERSGNFGTLDLIAALRWVRDNIAAFGGDPGNVTIFGESAGGQNVLTLLASPLAAGLFHRAIAQSPVSETFSLEQAADWSDAPLESHRRSAREVTAQLWMAQGRAADRAQARQQLDHAPAAEVAGFLRSLGPEQLLGVFTPGSVGVYLCPRPARDGVVLPREPLAQVFASGTWNRVPVILGSNRDEYRTFLADKPEHARLVAGKLPVLRDRDAYAAETHYASLAWRALHVDSPADAMLRGGHADVWTYRFDWDEAPAIPFVRPDLLLGAAHGMEMAFTMRDTRGELDIFGVNTPFNRAGRIALAQAMGDAWTSFAREGAPAMPGATWARRTLADGQADSLVFDSARGGGLRMDALRRVIGAIKLSLENDAAIASAQLRCRIYARVFLWNPLFAGHGDSAEYAHWCQRFGCDAPAIAFRPRVEV